MNYWAKNDTTWKEGHYVEEWELELLEKINNQLEAILKIELAAGNRITSINKTWPSQNVNVFMEMPIIKAKKENSEYLEFYEMQTPHDREMGFRHKKDNQHVIFPLD